MSGISLFIPVVLPVVDVFLVPYFELPTSDGYTRKFQTIGNSMSDMKLYDGTVNGTRILCHCTAVSGYHKCVIRDG